MPRVLFWLLVLWIGFELGADVYEARVSVAEWAANPPESLARWQLRRVSLDAGGQFWIYSTPGLGLLSLAVLAISSTLKDGRMIWIRVGAGLVFVTVLATLAWFVPTLLAIHAPQPAMSSAELAHTTFLWARLNWLRVAVYAAGWLSVVFGLAGYERALTLRGVAASANLRV